MIEQKHILRFHQRYDKVSSGCWEWNKPLSNNGYGSMWVKPKLLMSHRLSYMIHKGPIGPGLVICHTCDNPKCVNPDHLWSGTIADNNKDRHVKGRTASKLTEKQVLEIRKQYASGAFGTTLAKQLNVNNATVYNVINRETWQHI